LLDFKIKVIKIINIIIQSVLKHSMIMEMLPILKTLESVATVITGILHSHLGHKMRDL